MVVRRGLAADWGATAWTTGADGGFPDVTDDSPLVGLGPHALRALPGRVPGYWRPTS